MKELWLFLFAALAIIVVAWYTARRARLHSEKKVLKEQVQTWEDEGGNVPDVPTVNPAPGSSRTDSTRAESIRRT